MDLRSGQTPSLGTKVFRFSTSGVATTLLHLLVASFCAYALAFNGTASNGTAFIIANGFSYLMHSLWSFEAGVSITNFGRFFLVSLVCFLATVAISGVIDWLGYSAFYSIAAVIVFLPPLSFTVHNLWTFRHEPSSKS